LAIEKHVSWETVLSFSLLRLTNWINSGVKKIKRTKDGIENVDDKNMKKAWENTDGQNNQFTVHQ
jgi:hypothetical protein